MNWRQFLHGLVSALCHIHDKGNDIKSDNVVLDGDGLYIRGVLIDFGKGCLVKMENRINSLNLQKSTIHNITHRLRQTYEMVIVNNLR